MKYALIKNSKVVNIIRWDGVEPYTPPADCSTVPDDGSAWIGADWDGENFSEKPAPEPE